LTLSWRAWGGVGGGAKTQNAKINTLVFIALLKNKNTCPIYAGLST
jgi:hypothetical protein